MAQQFSLFSHLQTCIISGLVYFLCFCFEISCAVLLHVVIKSVCVKAHENSSRIWFAMNLAIVPIIPDLMYCIMGILIAEPFYAPLGGPYNIVMGFSCILSGVLAFASYTGCGNPAQIFILITGVLEILAAITHFVFFWFFQKHFNEG